MPAKKYREILQQSTLFMGVVGFSRSRDDYTDIPSEVRISEDLWREMGAPATVTVTVQPGDKLNGRQ